MVTAADGYAHERPDGVAVAPFFRARPVKILRAAVP